MQSHPREHEEKKTVSEDTNGFCMRSSEEGGAVLRGRNSGFLPSVEQPDCRVAFGS
jgi:hypothetical protein